jgi:hypothetical protein
MALSPALRPIRESDGLPIWLSSFDACHWFKIFGTLHFTWEIQRVGAMGKALENKNATCRLQDSIPHLSTY